MSEGYNGWTNYETWRVNLEVADDLLDGRGRVTAEEVKDEAEELIFMDAKEGSLVVDYATSFLSEVNWYEIAESHNSDLPDDDADDDADDDEEEGEND